MIYQKSQRSLKLVDESTMFVNKIHCKEFEQFFELSTKILIYLNENEKNKIKKITKFYKDKCKSSLSAKPRIYVDKD